MKSQNQNIIYASDYVRSLFKSYSDAEKLNYVCSCLTDQGFMAEINNLYQKGDDKNLKLNMEDAYEDVEGLFQMITGTRRFKNYDSFRNSVHKKKKLDKERKKASEK